MRPLKLFSILFTIILFSSCGDKNTTSKKTGNPPDTIKTVIGFPFNGELRIDFAWVLEKDTMDWTDLDSLNKTKRWTRGKYTFVNIGVPDSAKGVDGKLHAVLDSTNRPKIRQYVLQVPDSLIYFPKELDIDKIKKQHNLK